MEASLHESIVDAAVVCGRTHLAERLVALEFSFTDGDQLVVGKRSFGIGGPLCKYYLCCWFNLMVLFGDHEGF